MFTPGQFPTTRLRRLRGNNNIRNLIGENSLDVNKFILPLFIKDGTHLKLPIPSMPGHFQLSTDKLQDEIKSIVELGIQSILLFGIPSHKDNIGSGAYSDNGIIQRAIPIIKDIAPDLLIITDVCFCEYTDHGHCGIITHSSAGDEVAIDNDKTLELLSRQAISHAKAGADIIAPSCNMDGMVAAIRKTLDHSNYTHLPILSYAVKYSSSMYGPFRQAADGAPKFGNRKTYQMDYRNSAEAIREAALDVAEGADLIMVKPAHTYLDIIYKTKQAFPTLPLGAYHTSGEFAMIKAASKAGYMDEKEAVKEILTSIHRAGADFIISYYAKEVASWLA